MKKNMLVLLMAAVMGTNSISQETFGQNIQVPGATGAIREKGIPVGLAITSETIGPAGGTISYDDGRISVTVPQAALEENVSISIEPISSTLPATAGPGAFRLMPEGLRFKKPVTITFSYNDSIARGSSPEILHIAFQDHRGIWKSIRNVQLDKLKKTVAVQSTHFSDWAMFAQYQLLIDGSSSTNKIIIPNQKIKLNVEYTPLKRANNQEDEDEVLEPLVSKRNETEETDPDNELEPLFPGKSKNWKVFGPGVLVETSSSMKCIYQGPTHTPPGNKPIFFSVDLVNLPGKEYENAKIILFAQVSVENNYLEYEMKGEKIKFHLAQAFVNSEGMGISGGDVENGYSFINLAIGGTKAGQYPYGEIRNGVAEIGIIWKGKGYATNYYVNCDSVHPKKIFSKGNIIIETESSSNYLGIVKGSFRGTVYIPNCDGSSQDPTEIKGKFVVQVHVSGDQNIYTENYENHEKVMNNLLEIAKKLNMSKDLPKKIPKMPAIPKRKG